MSADPPFAETDGPEDGSSGSDGLSRRRFLGTLAIAAGAASIGTTFPPAHRRMTETIRELAEKHGNDPSLLIDLTKCVGCGACVMACKLDNHLEWREDQPAKGPDAALASSNWSVVQAEGRVGRDGESRYVKRQCMHCLEPSCASACFVKALRKSPEGPVLYDGNLCVGCRYCLMACPFSVPTFEWDKTFGRVDKCDFCFARTSKGEPSACAQACPVGAITFGHRASMLEEAWRRIGAEPQKYVPHVYGETEVGGTSMLYLSDVSFEKLGFRTGLPTDPIPSYEWKITRLIPSVAAGLGGTLVALYVRRRRLILEEEDAARTDEEVTA